MDICHNTVRTTSPFTGYLSSPSYPHIPADSSQREVSTSESVEVVCQCEIEAMSGSAQIELTLIDMYNSEQVNYWQDLVKPTNDGYIRKLHPD